MEIIKEVFPDDADENKVKDLVARISLARKSMVCLRNYLQEAASYEMKMVSVARLDSWKMVANIKGNDGLPVRKRRLRKYLRPTVHAELKEEGAGQVRHKARARKSGPRRRWWRRPRRLFWSLPAWPLQGMRPVRPLSERMSVQ